MRLLTARYSSSCPSCGQPIEPGMTIAKHGRGHVTHEGCPPAEGIPTTRERRQAKAERLQGWAEKRDARSDAEAEQASRMASVIPFGQPILVGHHSEGRDRRYRAQIAARMDAAVENQRTAGRMRQRAEGIERQLASSIYDDDPDAIEQLSAKLARLEGQRDRWTAYNAACRKAKGSSPEACALLDERQQAELAGLQRFSHLRAHGQAPSYVTTNLGGQIRKLRHRIERLGGQP